jgi:hypothetical protein
MFHSWQMQSIGCYIEEVHLVLSWAVGSTSDGELIRMTTIRICHE